MPEDLGDEAYRAGDRERREAIRVDLSAVVSLRRAGSLAYPVRVHDLSLVGCKVEFVDRPTVGERVWVKLDNLEVVGGVERWVSGDCVGLKFDQPLHPAVFQMLAAKFRSESG